MKKNYKLIGFILFFIYLSSVQAVQMDQSLEGPPYAPSTFYNSNQLYVPEVTIDNLTYIKGILELQDNGEYRVNSLTKLELDQEGLAKKIKSIPCGLADNLGQFSAYLSVINLKNYCLVKTRLISVEGNRVLDYLFIENGSISVITDYRNDPFRNSPYITSTPYDDIEFGYMDNDTFLKQETLENIDLERSYILKLIGKSGVESY